MIRKVRMMVIFLKKKKNEAFKAVLPKLYLDELEA